MKNSFYFDHDYSARNDQKILKLRAKYGLEGYGFFWCLIESMAEDTVGYIDGSAIDVLSLSYGIAIEKVKELLEYMLSIQLIEKCEHGNYFNKRILEHKKFRDERSRSGKKGAANKWKNQLLNGSANGSAYAKDSKGKDSKEDKEDISPQNVKHKYGEYQHVLLTNDQVGNFKTKYGDDLFNMALKILDEGIEMKGYKYKNHYLTMLKWPLERAKEKEKNNGKNQQYNSNGIGTKYADAGFR